MINLPVPITLDYVISVIREILRRSVDGTVVPLFVDYTNQRVLIGSTTVSANPAKVEVTGDIKTVNSSNGLILTAASGNTWRITIVEQANDDGTVYGVPVATRVS